MGGGGSLGKICVAENLLRYVASPVLITALGLGGSAYGVTYYGYTKIEQSVTGTSSDSVFEVKNNTNKDDGNLVNNSTIQNFNSVIAESTSANYGTIAGTGTNSQLSIGGKLTNNGTIQDFGSLTTVGDITNNTDSKITGIKNSALKTQGDLINKGNISTYTTITAKNVYNSDANAIMKATGGSLTANGNLKNSGLISEFGTISATGDLSNTKDITGAGSTGSKLEAGNLTNSGSISKYQTITATGAVTNEENASITGMGVGSNLNAGNLTNNGTISKYETVKATGDLKNTKTMTGTGSVNSKLEAGNLTNSGSISNYHTITATDVTNEADASITAMGSVVTKLEARNLTNSGSILNYYTITATNVTNKENASMTGVGSVGSKLEAGNLTNSGSISDYYTITATAVTNEADGTMTGRGSGSKLEAGNLTNSGSISSYQTITATDVTNEADGTMTGKGAGSQLTAGNLTNNGTISEYATVTATGDLENTKTMTGTGENSKLEANNVTNSGLISEFGTVTAKGYLKNEATGSIDATVAEAKLNVNGVDKNGVSVNNHGSISGFKTITALGSVFNSNANATITGTGAGSLLSANNVTNSGVISEFGTITATDVTNEADGTMTGMGVGSQLTVGNLTNNGTVQNYETVKATGDLKNTKTMTGTGENSKLEANNVTNSGSISGFGTILAAGDLSNTKDITGTGAGSLLSANNVTNSGLISEFGTITATSAVTNEADGTMTGTGAGSQLTVGNLTNNGTISDYETINVEKKITNSGTISNFQNFNVGTEDGKGEFVNDGGTLNLLVEDGDISNKINVNGTAVVNGGTVNVSGERMTVGETYVFIDTSNGNENGLTVDKELAVNAETIEPKLFHAEGFHNNRQYWLSLKRDYEYENNEYAETTNQKNTGRSLDQIAYSMDTTHPNYEETDAFKVFEALDNEAKAGNKENVQQAIDDMSGSIYANISVATLQNTWYVHQNLANMIRPFDCVYCDQDSPNTRDYNAWGAFIGNVGEIESDGNAHGYDYESYGVIVGSDFIKSDRFRLGAYFQYMDSDIDQSANRASAAMNNYDLGLYGIFRHNHAYFLASANIGYASYDVTRNVAFGTGADTNVNRTHVGATNSSQQSFRLEAGRDFVTRNRETLLRPFAAITYSHLQMDGVSESSVDKQKYYITELESHDYELDSLRSEIGLRASRCFETDRLAIGITGRATWVHEFCDTNATLANKFNTRNEYQNASSFLVSGTDLGHDYAWLGLGFTADTSTAWSFFGGYDALVNSDALIHNFNVGVALNW